MRTEKDTFNFEIPELVPLLKSDDNDTGRLFIELEVPVWEDTDEMNKVHEDGKLDMNLVLFSICRKVAVSRLSSIKSLFKGRKVTAETLDDITTEIANKCQSLVSPVPVITISTPGRKSAVKEEAKAVLANPNASKADLEAALRKLLGQ